MTITIHPVKLGDTSSDSYFIRTEEGDHFGEIVENTLDDVTGVTITLADGTVVPSGMVQDGEDPYDAFARMLTSAIGEAVQLVPGAIDDTVTDDDEEKAD